MPKGIGAYLTLLVEKNCSIPLIHLFTPVLKPHCLKYYDIIKSIHPEEVPQKIVLAIPTLHFHVCFRITAEHSEIDT